MTFILKLDLDLVKMQHHVKNGSFYVNSFKSYSPNRHTDRHDENVTSTVYAGGKDVATDIVTRTLLTDLPEAN